MRKEWMRAVLCLAVLLVATGAWAQPASVSVQQLTTGTEDCEHGDYSPNGAWIVYQRDPDDNTYSPDGGSTTWTAWTYGELWKIKKDGTGDTQLTGGRWYDDDGDPGTPDVYDFAGYYCDSKPDWSPDGKWIVFQRYELPQYQGGSVNWYYWDTDGDGDGDVRYGWGYRESIWKVKANGAAEKRLAMYEDVELDAVETDYDSDGEMEQVNVGPDGRGCVGPEWSPDGAWVAFKREEGSYGSEVTSVSVVKADGTGLKEITSGNWALGPMWQDLDWKPAGAGTGVKLLASMTKTSAWSASLCGRQVMLLNRNNMTKNAVLTPENLGFVSSHDARFAPNGRKIAYRDNAFYYGDIWTMKANGGAKLPLTNNMWDEYVNGWSWVCYSSPQWSPNGKYIAYYYNNNDGRFVGVMTKNGAHKLLVTGNTEANDGVFGTDPSAEYLLKWSPTGNQILFIARDGVNNNDHLWTVDLNAGWEDDLLAN